MATKDNNQERGDSQWDSPNVIETLFPLGRVILTVRAYHTVPLEDIRRAIVRHATGDWGELCEDDWAENQTALQLGYRLLSGYRSSKGIRFWIITEADRSVTTVLLPEEY